MLAPLDLLWPAVDIPVADRNVTSDIPDVIRRVSAVILSASAAQADEKRQ